MVKLKLSLPNFYGCYHHLVICDVCNTNDYRYVLFVVITSQFCLLSWFIIDLLTRASSGDGIAYSSRAYEFTPGVWGVHVVQYFNVLGSGVWIIVFPVGHCIAWCGSLFFLLAIVLPGVDHCFSCRPLYCMSFLFDSDYTFGIFKPFH